VLPPNARKKKYWKKAKEGKPVREREKETLLCAAKKNYANFHGFGEKNNRKKETAKS
jgi:hypothetical protein